MTVGGGRSTCGTVSDKPTGLGEQAIAKNWNGDSVTSRLVGGVCLPAEPDCPDKITVSVVLYRLDRPLEWVGLSRRGGR